MASGTPPGVLFVWEQAERRLEAQLRQADSLDTKAGALVGLHALAAGIVASQATGLSSIARWVVVTVIAMLVVGGFLAFLAYRIEAYDRDPSPIDLWRFGSWEDDQIRYRFLDARFESLQANDLRLHRKAGRVAWSLTGLWVVALVVAIAGIVGLVTHR